MADIISPQLRFEITLKRLAMTSLISKIYDHSDIKEKIKEIINTKYQGKSSSFPRKSIKKEIIKIASKKVVTFELPRNLIAEVQGVLIFFAEKVASWAEFVICTFEMDVAYLDKIYWSHVGTINDQKIFHEFWKSHQDGSLCAALKSDKDETSFFLNMACKYATEEIFLVHRDEIIKKVQKFLKNIQLPDIKNQVDQIMGTYMCYMFGVAYDMTHKADVHKKFMETGKVSIQEFIFMCDGNPNAVKYLWKFLNKKEKDWIIIQLAFDNLRKGLWTGMFYLDKCSEIEMFKISGYAEIVCFLLNEMSVEHRNEFFMHTATKLVELFLRIWPYPEFCLIMLNNEWICEIILQDCPNVILHKLLCRMIHDTSHLAYITGKCRYPNVFYELLKKILSLVPKGTKEMIFFEASNCSRMGITFPQAIENFYHIFDVKALSIIINDKHLKHKRNLMISMGSDKISKLLNLGNLKSVINFMEKILLSNEERKKFVKKWDLENHVEVANNADIREKILNWLSA